MFRCERCGTAFGPIQAAVLEFCPRCRARDHVDVPLIDKRVKDPPGQPADQKQG
jgi:predicted  nucleic acid-binding Zn-ribbon protein